MSLQDHLLLLRQLLLLQLLLCFECSRCWLASLGRGDVALAAGLGKGLTRQLAGQVLIIDCLRIGCTRGSLAQVDTTTVPLPRESFDFAFDRFVDKVGRILTVRALRVRVIVLAADALGSVWHLLALIHSTVLVSCGPEVSRLGKRLALVELMEVR